MGNFDEFVTVRSHRLLHLAYLLTRDHALAEDLLQTTLAKSWTVWERIGGDPEPYVRRIMINTFNSWWRRRWNGEISSGELPELVTAAPQSTVDDRDEVWRALARLPKRQRTVVVLRYFEDLSERQIADVMSISASAVRSYVTKALAKLRTDPSLLTVTVPEPPHGIQRLAAVRHRVDVSHRRRVTARATILGAALMVLLVGVSAMMRPVNSTPPAVPSPSPSPEYLQGYRTVFDEQMSFATRSSTFTYTPSTMDLRLLLECSTEDLEFRGFISLQLNGQDFMGEECTAFTRPSPTVDIERLREIGVEAGKPVTIGIRVLNAADSAMAEGTVRVVIEEQVAFENYVLPKAPAVLKPLWQTSSNLPSGAIIISDIGPQKIRWTSHMRLTGLSQTPGQLVVKVNGKVLWVSRAEITNSARSISQQR